MASLNKVMVIGNLGRDPEVRATAAGTTVTTMAIATSEKFKNRNGEMEERTEWHRVTLWGKLAEIARDYLAKGRTVYIEGRLQTRKWTDRDGNDRYTTEIVGDRMQMLGGRGDGGGNTATRSEPNQASTSQEPDYVYDEPVYQDDDIPF